jgi:hypothetical protein
MPRIPKGTIYFRFPVSSFWTVAILSARGSGKHGKVHCRKRQQNVHVFLKISLVCVASLNMTQRTPSVDMIPVLRSWDRSRGKEKESGFNKSALPSPRSHAAVVGGTNHTEWSRASERWILPGRRRVDSERRSVGFVCRRLRQATRSSSYAWYESSHTHSAGAAVWCAVAVGEDVN